MMTMRVRSILLCLVMVAIPATGCGKGKKDRSSEDDDDDKKKKKKKKADKEEEEDDGDKSTSSAKADKKKDDKAPTAEGTTPPPLPPPPATAAQAGSVGPECTAYFASIDCIVSKSPSTKETMEPSKATLRSFGAARASRSESGSACRAEARTTRAASRPPFASPREEAAATSSCSPRTRSRAWPIASSRA